ncbi:MAG: hypothetical protein K9J13_04660 [Saprospiraceae bacterium]|nr:hypothetical protein [Saprospiraceae bacterium]
MKKLKRVFALVIVIAFILPAFQSCGKYADGPFFSLRTKTMRLTAEWELDEIDGDSPDADVFWEFEKGGDFTQTVEWDGDKFKTKATWAWGTGKESIDFEPDKDDTLSDDWSVDILRLTKNELWLEDEDGDEWIFNKVK